MGKLEVLYTYIKSHILDGFLLFAMWLSCNTPNVFEISITIFVLTNEPGRGDVTSWTKLANG